MLCCVNLFDSARTYPLRTNMSQVVTGEGYHQILTQMRMGVAVT